jgi:hypothetical protein
MPTDKQRFTNMKHIVSTSTPRTELRAGIAQAVVTAAWSDGTLTTEALSSLRFTGGKCIKI